MLVPIGGYGTRTASRNTVLSDVEAIRERAAPPLTRALRMDLLVRTAGWLSL